MDDVGKWLDLLAMSTQAVNQLRAVLAAVNVPLPAFVAQLLCAVVLGAVGWYSFHPAAAPERSLERLGARAVLAAAVLGIASILIAWIDNLVAPRSHEIVGRVSPGNVESVQIDLLDYQDQSMGAAVTGDDHGAFVVRYQPAFADPPSAVMVKVPGCESRRQPLRRAHLLGTPLHVQLECGGTS